MARNTCPGRANHAVMVFTVAALSNAISGPNKMPANIPSTKAIMTFNHKRPLIRLSSCCDRFFSDVVNDRFNLRPAIKEG